MILDFDGMQPVIHDSAHVAPTAVIVGDVHLGQGCSIWFNTVVRGDVNHIRIGCRTNIQDLCMLHVSGSKKEGDSGAPLVIGDDVTVGHGVTLHGCTIEQRAFIGMNAVILDGCVVGSGAMIAAGSLLPPGTIVPPDTLWMGRPATFRRLLTGEDREKMASTAASYLSLAERYRHNSPTIIAKM
jgi:carbonic anhydrase/acetyltransferase-like protein (isoleucine patch superfamily)